MSGMKQVKVDNWGIFFLQRLKHFFNRTDYCDLTLQFQDNAQLKVHRLVLNACTEYFELLERTCEMYEDCLIMPDDLQADVVVPIVNFMYTGQLEYKFNLFDRLYATAQIMNMSVLTKLLDAQRVSQVSPAPKVSPQIEFQSNRPIKKPYTQKKVYIPSRKYGRLTNDISIAKTPPPTFVAPFKKRQTMVDSARPTRYELPEELDHDEIFESSFSDISYESRPLMVHPKLIKEECKEEYRVVYNEASSSRKFEDLKRTMKRPSTSSSDIEPKRLNMGQNKELMFEDRSRDDYLIDDDVSNVDIFDTMSNQCVVEDSRIMQVREDSNSLFDQAAGESSTAKVTLDTRSLKQGGENVDHAKIISEVLKKYPHLVKNNKNIKLRIMTTPNKSESKTFAKKTTQLSQQREQRQVKNAKQVEESKADWTISDIMDTKEVGRLVSLGVENVNGPWLCLICGTPGKALNFISYHKYRRHLTEVHKEKVAPNICEYCGLKSGKRNHLLHHIYTKHGVPPPPSHHFPKCNQCNYIALTEAFLIKHKLSHLEVREFTCNVCAASFKTTPQLLQHIQSTGHKISPDRKSTNQCMYCQKLFLREANLYAHLKIVHKTLARSDGIIDNSDEEQEGETGKYEVSNYNISEESHEEQYQIQQQLDGKIQILTKRTNQQQKQQHKILNKSLDQPSSSRRIESPKTLNKIHHNVQQDLLHGLDQNVADTEAIISADGSIVDRIVVLNQNEYILKPADTQLERSEADAQLERNMRSVPMDTDEYILSDVLDTEYQNLSSTINISLPQQNNTMQLVQPKVTKNQAHIIIPQPKQGIKKSTTINQPIQIVVSNEQDYKNLVSSASSIIFDDGTQSKSLSVMSRGAPVSANINLDSVDGNNMMILQEEFNVSQAVTTDNSNIVVVYSHPVEGQNKEYSIDTTYTEAQVENRQEIIESQVVDNSMVESEHQQVKLVEEDINSQVLTEENLVHETVENWQEHTIDQTTNVSELPLSSQVVEILDTTLTPIDEPEQVETESPEGILEESQSQDTIIEEHEEVLTSEETNVTTLIVSEPEIEHNFVNDENIAVSEEQVPDDTLVQVDSTIHESEVEVVQEEDENHVHETEIEQSVVITESEVQEKILEQNIEVNSTEPIVEEADADADSPVNEEKEQTTDVKETVATLTSEWSDEEVSNKDTSPTIEEPCSEVPVEHQIEEPAEIEESIENIQEEVQKQLNEVSVPILLSNTISNNVIIETQSEVDDNNEVSENNEKPSDVSVDDSIATETEEEDDVATPKSNDKISSLLNEWEDNDSQNETTETIEEPVVDQSKDNIKSLVSDWDEDEEIKK